MHHFDQNYQYEHEQQQSRFYQQQQHQQQQQQHQQHHYHHQSHQHPKNSEVQNSSHNLNFSVNNNHVQSNLNMVAVTGSQQNMDMCFNSQVSWLNKEFCLYQSHSTTNFDQFSHPFHFYALLVMNHLKLVYFLSHSLYTSLSVYQIGS